jgi:hypothetical protein
LRPDSAIARSTLRPMRPNPLIATRIAIQLLLKGSKIPCSCGGVARLLGSFMP